MNTGTGLDILQKALPERYYDVGIAEQHAVLFAAGLALAGAKPVAAIYSTFLQRGFDQIVHDVCLQKLNVVFAMDRAGLVGDDGPTHHGAFDISYLRCLPNMVLMAPRDEAMLADMLHTALRYDDGPGRAALPARRGRGRAAAQRAAARSRSAAARCCARASASRCSATATACRWRSAPPTLLDEHGIEATVADARFAKPLDVELHARARGRARAARDGRGERAGRAASASAVVEALLDRDLGRRGAPAALRPAGPLRDPRQARAAARGGRASRRRRSPSAWPRPCSSRARRASA